jgi:hypothetical protein
MAMATWACSPVESSDPPAASPEDAQAAQAATDAAVDLVQQMSAFLAAQPRLAFEADVAYDVLQANGELIEFGATRRVVVRRPNRVFVEARGRDGERRLLYFNGQQLAFALPEAMIYATSEAPGTLDQAIDDLATHGIPTPLAELISSDPWETIGPDIESGSVIGTELLDNTACDHVALRTDGIDLEIWIGAEGEPLPYRLVIRYRDEPGSPTFQASFLTWDLDPPTPDGRFDFSSPKSAEGVPFDALSDYLFGRSEEAP